MRTDGKVSISRSGSNDRARDWLLAAHATQKIYNRISGIVKKSAWKAAFAFLAFSFSVAACSSPSSPSGPSNPSAGQATYDLVALGVPQFIDQQFIPLANINRISRFRSSEGHSYNNGESIPGEPCRSLKHYFSFLGFAPSTQSLSSPVDGAIQTVENDGMGTGLGLDIVPTAQPAFLIRMFHLAASIPLAAGMKVTAGQPLGTVQSGVESDIAIAVNTPQGPRLVSWFDAITESLFQEYRARGVASRSDMIISQAERDAHPLDCDSSGAFTSSDTLPRFVAINGYTCPVPSECLGQ